MAGASLLTILYVYRLAIRLVISFKAALPCGLFKLTRQTHLWERLSGDLIIETAKPESAGRHAPFETYDGLGAMLGRRRRTSFEGRKRPTKI
jgi:hypothetical protein